MRECLIWRSRTNHGRADASNFTLLDLPFASRESMLRITIACLIALALQVTELFRFENVNDHMCALQSSALPEYIENLERDLAALPAEYQYLADEVHSKRAANADRE